MQTPSYEEQYAFLEKRIDALKTDKTGDEHQTEGEVFDRKTLMTIYGFMRKGMIDRVLYPLSTGKEGNVFLAANGDSRFVALKIYRTSTSTFKRITEYVRGDPRFRRIAGNRWRFIYAWCSKEFRNLGRYHKADLPVPEPIANCENCLLMEYIGNEHSAAPRLKDAVLDDPADVYEKTVSFIVNGWRDAHLVHGDLSEYNILMADRGPIVIDTGQAMASDWFNAKELLDRDIRNVNRFFKSLGADITEPDKIKRECFAPRDEREGDDEEDKEDEE